ncbi:MAG: hypothetical protein KAQ84_00990, partial [Thermoplasmatales archaeon]|nr:hypothetical protein [Thermoplasmatales archaeon]
IAFVGVFTLAMKEHLLNKKRTKHQKIDGNHTRFYMWNIDYVANQDSFWWLNNRYYNSYK